METQCYSPHKNASGTPGYERQKQTAQPWISLLDRLSKSKSSAAEVRSVAINKLREGVTKNSGDSVWEPVFWLPNG